MNLGERFQLAFQSHLGPLLIALFGLLCLLGGLYWFLVVRQRKRDLLAYHHRAHYEKAMELSQTLNFHGAHKADFFGRQTIVCLGERQYGLCIIPPPDLSSPEMRDRFRCFWRATHFQQLPLFAPYVWKQDEEMLVLVQDQLIDRNGRRFLTLKHFLGDKKLLQLDREEILLEIARALSRLHDLHAEYGGQTYHGFLLPRSIVLELDAGNRVRHLAIADAGLAFTLGPEKLCQQLNKVRTAKLPLESYCSQEIIEQMSYLAPEQKDLSRLHDVGPSSDFFAFGALAIALFTRQRFTSRDAVKWERIPERWRPFIEACLSNSTYDRPQDFLELEDWLADPELALTHQTQERLPKNLKTHSTITDSLSSMIDRVQTTPQHQVPEQLENLLQSAEEAMSSSRWKAAKKQLEKALPLDPNHALTHVKLAIVALELGDEKSAERHYNLAKQLNPKLAKQFRDHLAFKM